MAVAGIEQQLLGARPILNERRAQFDEFLRDREAGIDRRYCAAEARQKLALLGGIRLQHLVIVAMFEADVHADALARKRRGDAILAELAGRIGMQRAQSRGSRRGAEQVQIVESGLRDAAVAEDIVRHAAAVAAADAGWIGRSSRHQQGVGNALVAQVLLVGV